MSGIPDVKVFTGSDYGYRTRLDMGFHRHGIGFRKKGNWRVILDIEECPISNTRINELIKEVREYFGEVDAIDTKTRVGSFHHALIRATRLESAISIVLNKDSTTLEAAIARVKQYAHHTSAEHLLITYVGAHSGSNISEEFEVLKGSSELRERILDKTFSFSIQGFFQNNSEMAEKMHEYCHEVLRQYPTADQELIDLYGGVGTFGIVNASLFKRATTIESFPGCIESAKKNIAENGITNASALLLDAKDLKSLQLHEAPYIILDPPRGGMHAKTIKEVLRLKPKLILFVCCNVPQLKIYLSQFVGYKPKSAAMFDLFPQTPHCEAVLELVPG